eukprot:scaffold97046_cov20-Tisochrysis_lutea.AAC.1
MEVLNVVTAAAQRRSFYPSAGMEGEGDVKAVEMCEMPRDGQLGPYEEDEEGVEDGDGNGPQAGALPQWQHQQQQLAAEEGGTGGGGGELGGAMDALNDDGLAAGRAGNSSDDHDGDDGDDQQGDGADAGERDEGYYSTLTHGVRGAGGASAQAGAPEAAWRVNGGQEPRPPPAAWQAQSGEE